MNKVLKLSKIDNQDFSFLRGTPYIIERDTGLISMNGNSNSILLLMTFFLLSLLIGLKIAEGKFI